MPPLSSTFAPALRVCARHRLSLLRTSPIAVSQQRNKSDSGATAYFDHPFRPSETQPTTKVPDFGKYKSNRGATSNVVFQYFMAGSMGLLAAAGAKATVQGMFPTLRLDPQPEYHFLTGYPHHM